jgi:hypothetical protein
VQQDAARGKPILFVAADQARVTLPLALPRGSIRSLVSLSLAGVAWVLILSGRSVPPTLWSLLLTVLAYYFGFRNTQRRGGRGLDPSQTPARPLNLPRGAIRGVLAGGFLLCLAVLLQRDAFDRASAEFFVLVVGLIVGHGFARLLGTIRGTRLEAGLAHLRGLAVLLAAATLVITMAAGVYGSLPFAVSLMLFAVVSFYFGSRS